MVRVKVALVVVFGKFVLEVVDNALCCVVVLDPFGVLLDVYGYQNGAYWTGELQLPIDAASNGLKVFVTSGGEGHVNVFEVTPLTVTTEPSRH